MNLKKRITSQNNWKAKIRLALLVPLLVVVIYIVAQSGAVDFSSITGFATLGAKGDDNLPEEVNDTSKESIRDDSSDYDLLHLKDIGDEDIEDNAVDAPAENKTDDNETVLDSPIILSSGGGGGSSGGDNPPIVENPPVDDDPIPNTTPSMPANFWGQLYIGGNLSDAGETITVKVKALDYTTNTQDNGYYTITVPGSEGDIIEFFYSTLLVGSSSWAEGKTEQIDLHF